MKRLLVFLFFGALITTFYLGFKDKDKKIIETTKSIDYSTYNIQKNEALINHYSIYGTHLNLKGSINISNNNIKKIELVLIDINKKEISYNLLYSVKDQELLFNTSEYINDGINLENINIGTYDALIKTTLNDNTFSYYLLKNKTNYNTNTYYTLTKNYSNKEIKMKFINDKYPRFNMQVTKIKLPSDVYDIVIDAGHGGKDVGTSGYNYYEKTITLDYSKRLKDVIEEELGFKVKLTRTTDETLDNYNKDGRVDRINGSKAKYNLSIHLNNTNSKYYSGGVEIYGASSLKLDFAKSLADNIVESAKTSYSTNNNWKVDKGIYVRTLNSRDLEDLRKEAEKGGFTPYEVADNTTYYFMIREVGGIVTNAYVDGRNSETGKNIHYLDNIGIESYLVELGYMNNANNMKSLLNDKEKYIQGIVKALKEHLLGE